MEKAHKKLFVWQKADEFAYLVYLETKSFPADEMYGLTSQLRRAAISVSCNITEGAGRQNKNEFKQFVNIALGSVAEVEYLLEFSYRMKYLKEEKFKTLENLRHQVGGLLWNLYKSFSR